MLRIAVCEDEGHTLAELAEQVERFFSGRGGPYSLSRFTSGEQLLLGGIDFDIVLLDIRLPGMSGMEAARQLRDRGKECAIIFITSSREDVFRAFDVDATHFLIKPVEQALLFRALEKAERQIRDRSSGWLTISRGQSVRKLPFAEIIYCEALNHQVAFCMSSGERVAYYHRLSELLDKLDHRFYHCHRSYVINLAHVAALENQGVRMSNGDCVMVARRCKKELSQRLLTFLRGEMIE